MRLLLKNSYIQNLLDFIFPQLCLGCGEYCENEIGICSKCESSFEVIKLPYCLHCLSYIDNQTTCEMCKDKTLALFSYADYAGAMREIIIQYKFKGITTPAEIFAKRICKEYAVMLKNYNADFLVPIPLHKSRESGRGYNQASILAYEIGKFLNLPVNESLIFRTKKRKPQAKLAISERKENIDSVFSVDEPTNENKKCILIDDVVTTGNTVFEATKELENSEYKVVAVISIAHTL